MRFAPDGKIKLNLLVHLFVMNQGPVVLSRDYHDAQIIGNAFRKAECRVEDDKLHSGILCIRHSHSQSHIN